MKSFDIIYVVCTYGATEDLKKFIKSVNSKKISSHIIVANSFCDENTRDQISIICKKNNCDFLDLENKGYGHSINDGIEYAQKNYDYKYLIISNADIIIKRVDLSHAPQGEFVLAPEIITKNNKRQNPFYIFPHFKLFKFSKWFRDTFNLPGVFVMVVAKLERIIFNLILGKKRGGWYKIFAGHGAHILFSKEAINRLKRPFEDDVFLYCEENFLGYKLRKLDIPYYYSCDVSVVHTEDGSQAFYKHKINDETRKSMMKYHKLIKSE